MTVPKGGAADWTEERGSEERATGRRGKSAGPSPPAAQSKQSNQTLFEDEVRDAVRYERWLAVKCVTCLLLVLVVLAVRAYLFG